MVPIRILLIVQFLLTTLVLHQAAAQVTASFSVNNSSGCRPLTVQFTNTSQNATSFQWDFGNGNSSTLASPSNIYTTPGIYQVTLTASGISGSSSAATIITVSPVPVAAFSVSSASACQNGNAIQFINQSAGYDSCIWDFGDGITSHSVNPWHVYSLPGNFTVTLVVFDKATGCSNSITKNQLIQVLPAPVFTVTVDDSSTCNTGHSFAFSATGQSISSWLWDFGDGTQSLQQNPFHIYSDTGKYDVSVIVTSASGCTDTLIKDDFIHVKSNPVPPIIASDSAGCVPMNVSFQTKKNGVSTFLWDLGDGGSDSIYIAYHNYIHPGSYTVNLSVVYTNGCSNSNSFGPVSVDSIPSFTYTISNNAGCAPLNVNFTNFNAGAPYTWLWNFGDGITSTAAVPVHSYTTDGTFTVSLYATSQNGCTWGYPLSAKVKVSSPQASFSPDKTSGCLPLTVNFNNHSLNASSYEWHFGDGSVSTQANPSHIYNATGVYDVMLIAFNNNGCRDTFIYGSQISVSMAGNAFNPLPPVTACAPFTMHFEDNSPATSWLWEFGDGTTSTLQNPEHTYELPGTYVVSLSTYGGSGGCSQHIPELRTIIINSGHADFTHTESLCPPYEAFFTDSSANAVAWYWSFGDGATSTAQNPSHVFSTPGYHNISLTITTPEGCEASTVKNFEVYFEPLTATATTYVADTLLPMTVQFYSNTTGATWWLWTFGDGDSSSLEDPAHIYSTAGPHTVSLTIGNDSCSRTYNYQPQTYGSGVGTPVDPVIGIPVPPPPLYNCAPFTVNFQNPYPAAVSWLWDFGDGNTSSSENPEHTYTASGDFEIKLHVVLPWGNDSITLPEIVHVRSFDTDFTIQSENSCSGTKITLTPADTAGFFFWEFGDGTTSTDTTATHIYTSSAYNYLITVIATDTNGCVSSATKTFYASEANPLTSGATRVCAGDTVQFSSGGLNYSSCLWDFGDGSFSALQDPEHVYQDSGIYVVSLTVSDSTGCSKTFSLQQSIQVFDPHADFAISNIVPYCSYVAAQITNLSTGYDQLSWDLGNGQVVSQTPTYAYYYTPGNYTITLTASGNVCTSQFTSPVSIVVPDLQADFSYVQSGNCTPVTMTFTDQSNDAVKWLWDFGDGNTDTVQHPVHIYNTVPSGSVTLTVEDIYGCISKKIISGIYFGHADFSVGSATGCVPLSVSFSDSSIDAVSWFWDFGDGTQSTDSNPFHVYQDEGAYDVMLIITTAAGCIDTIIRNDYVKVGDVSAGFAAGISSGCAPVHVTFTDSSYNAASWLWDFGDGSFSNSSNPSHIYNSPGTYDVTLIVSDSAGCSDTLIRPSSVIIYGAVPVFAISAAEGCAPFGISPVNLSQDAVMQEWNFGNGVTDTAFEASQIYLQPGSYQVSLTVYDTSGCMSVYTLPDPVLVHASPEAGFSLDSYNGCSPYQPAITNLASGYDSITWVMGDGSVYNDSVPSHAYNQGNYQITQIVLNAEGCMDTLISDTLHIHLSPGASFTASDTTGCAPAQISFYNTSVNLDDAVFLWSFGNGIYSYAQDTTLLFLQPGSYPVSLSVINKGGCTDIYQENNFLDIYDATPPPSPSVYSASVLNDNAIEVRWSLVNAQDLNHYVLYRLNAAGSSFDSVGAYIHANGTVVAIPQLTDTVNTQLNPYTYKVAAVDKCGSRADTSLLKAHTTVFLTAVPGPGSVLLSWTRYEGCSTGGYNIYRDDGNGNYIYIGSTDSLTTLYMDATAFCPWIYKYKVEAADLCAMPGENAFSNSAEADMTAFQWQQEVEMVRATVVNNSYVLTEWKAPLVMPQTITSYDVYRSVDNANYEYKASVDGNQLYYEDFDTDVHHQNYYYRIVPVNYCNLINPQGDESSSILLKGDFMENGKARLRWTHYTKWDTGVSQYILERQKEDGSWEAVQSVDGSVNTIMD